VALPATPLKLLRSGGRQPTSARRGVGGHGNRARADPLDLFLRRGVGRQEQQAVTVGVAAPASIAAPLGCGACRDCAAPADSSVSTPRCQEGGGWMPRWLELLNPFAVEVRV